MRYIRPGLIPLLLLLGSLAATTAAADSHGARDSYAGKVTGVTDHGFEIASAGETFDITVNDWNAVSEAYPVLAGKQVTVYGKAAGDDTQSIDASHVYVDDFKAYFFMSAADGADPGQL
ncbi:MAG: hypothetical protein RLW62_24200 [Gammaproteobacteria bacterium]